MLSLGVYANSIEIIANKAIINKDTGIAEYIGQAYLTHNGIELAADSIKIVYEQQGQYQVYAIGSDNNLATFNYKNVDLKSRARNIIYLSKDSFIQLKGNVSFNQSGNYLAGEDINYDIINNKVLMSGDGGKRVKLKIKL